MNSQKYLLHKIIMGMMLITGSINISLAQTILAAEMPTSYDVSNSGAFTYSVPLRIPPGILDMVPNLAIAYNSQGGNGQLGTGWTIQGLSSITKVPIDIYHNTNIRPVDFYNSQYALDGQRLIATTFPFTSTYYTENKNFAKITQYGTSGNGPSYFIVEYPNGTTYEYGNTTDSKMMGSGRTDVLIWALNKIYDKHGNYITFEYYNDNYIGDYRIRKISYTGNSVISTAPSTEINFNYTAKPDVGMSWIDGSTVTDGYLLSSIEINQNASMINKYIFEYHNGSYYGSRLVKIREQRPGNIELPPIDIKWGKEDQINPSPVYSIAYASTNPNGSGDSLLMIGDFNADGMSDYTVRTPSWNSSVDVKMHLNNKSDEFASAQTTNVPNSTWLNVLMNRARNMTVDYNGDGFDDMITYTNDYNSSNNTSTWTVYKSLSNGSTLGVPVQIFQYYYTANTGQHAGSMSDDIRILPGDFDGDGKKDLFVIVPRDYNHTSYECFIIGDMYPNGILHQVGSSNGVVQGGEYRYLAYLGHDVQTYTCLDYNGDGRQDILVTSSTSSTELYELNVDYTQPNAAYGIANTGTSMNLLYWGSYPGKDHQLYIGDFNGDGKQDLLTWIDNGTSSHIGTWDMAYSTGAGGTVSTAFDYKTAPSDLNPYGGSFPNYFRYFIGDFDGNGKDDILQMDNDQWNPTPLWTICYYSGYNHTAAESFSMSGFPVNTGNYGLGDFNGDGQTDLLWTGATGGGGTYPIIVYFHKNDLRQLVSSITNAGRRIEVENANLPQMTDYTTYPSSNSLPVQLTFPFVSKQIPMNVISGLRDYVASNHTPLSLDKSYQYSSLVYNMQGLGCQGFAKMDIIDNAESTITENIFNNTSGQPVTYLESSTKWDLSTFNGVTSQSIPGIPTNTPIWKQSQLMTDLGSGLVHNLIFDVEKTNYKLGTYTRTYPVITDAQFYDSYGCPDSVIEIQGDVRIAKGMTYDVNAAFNNITKPIKITTVTQKGNKSPYIRSVAYSYSGNGHILTETTDPSTTNSIVKSFSYDFYGNLISTTISPNSMGTRTILATYSSDGRFKLSETDAMGFTKSYSVNDWGAILTTTDIKGLTTVQTYDAVNRPLSVTLPTSATTTYDYDWATNYSSDNPSFTNAQFVNLVTTANVTTYKFMDYYSNQVREVSTAFDGQAIYKDTRYFKNGLTEFSTAPYYKTTPLLANVSSYSYDLYGRLTQTSITYGPTITNSYNIQWDVSNTVAGIQMTTINTSVPSLSQKTIYTDASGTKTRITDGNNNMDFDYGSHGKIESVKTNNDPNLESDYTYDNFARAVSKYQAGIATETFDYNALNQLTHEHYGLSTDVYFDYDDLGRLIQKTNPDGAYNYTYNNIANQNNTGLVASITSPSNTRFDYTYDSYGRLSEFVQNTGEILTSDYSYDEYGRELTHQFPGGDVIQNNYNKFGYLESIDLIGGQGIIPQKLWKVNSRNVLDQITEAEYYDQSGGSLYMLDKGYSPNGNPASITFGKIGQPLSVDFSYDFDMNSGDLMRRDDHLKGSSGYYENFNYDGFDRLTTVNQYQNGVNTHNLNMNYDDVGNILKKDDVTPSTHDWKYWGYQLVQVPDPQISTPTYILPASEQTETYTQSKKVKTIEENGKHLDFAYWPDDQRAIVEASTLHTPAPPTIDVISYYGQNFDMQVDPVTGISTSQSYVIVEGKIIAVLYQKLSPPPPGSPRSQGNIMATTVYYTVTDHLGSITHIFDNVGVSNNGLIEERSYDAWGRPRDPNTWKYYNASTGFIQPTWLIDRGYTGHEHYADFGIINMNGRLYDPLVARMFNSDPVLSNENNPQAYNKYSYVNNNPLKYSDPTGNNPAVLLASAVIGGVINCLANYNHIDNFGSGLKYFGVGFVAGLAGGAVGEVASVGATGLYAGIASGAAGGAAGGFVGGAGNSWIRGGNFSNMISSGMAGYATGLLGGAVIGGLSGGVWASASGKDFFTGNKVVEVTSPNPTLTDRAIIEVKDMPSRLSDDLVVADYSKTDYGLKILAGYGAPSGEKYVEYNWIQYVETNYMGPGTGSPLLDNAPDNFPFYNSLDQVAKYNGFKGWNTILLDKPQRGFDMNFVYWKAQATILGKDAAGFWHPIGTIQYGFEQIDGNISLMPLRFVNPAPGLKFLH